MCSKLHFYQFCASSVSTKQLLIFNNSPVQTTTIFYAIFVVAQTTIIIFKKNKQGLFCFLSKQLCLCYMFTATVPYIFHMCTMLVLYVLLLMHK